MKMNSIVTDSKERERFLKFSVVGAIGALVDFGSFHLFMSLLGIPPVWAQVCSFTAAVTSNFIWNRYWTFPDSRSRSAGTQFVQFFIISIVGLVFRLFFVGFTYPFFGNIGASILPGDLDATAVAQLGSNIAQAISIGIVMFWNFFANRLWTFRDVDEAEDAKQP